MPADFAGLQIWDQRETYESRKMGDRRGKEKDMRNEISMLPKSLAAYRWSLDMIEEQLRQKMNMRSNYVGNYKFQNAYSMFREHTKRHNKVHGQMTPEEFTHFLRLKFDLFLQPPEVAMLMTKCVLLSPPRAAAATRHVPQLLCAALLFHPQLPAHPSSPGPPAGTTTTATASSTRPSSCA